MVQNKQELRVEAEKWLGEASEDLSSRFNELIQSTGVQPAQIADLLDVDVDTVNAILNGNIRNITAETLIKLFVANDLSIEVMPVGMSPIGQYGQRPTPNGGFGAPMGGPVPMGGHRRPMPMGGHRRPMPMGGFGAPMGGIRTPIPPVGGFRGSISGQPTQIQDPFNGQEVHTIGDEVIDRRQVRPTRNVNQAAPTHYDSRSDNELNDLIAKNGWANEINLNLASKNEKIQFLLQKEAEIARYETNVPQSNVNASPVEAEDGSMDKAVNIAKQLIELAKTNPEIAEQLHLS